MSTRILAAITALALGACSQQATVTRTDGPPVEGVIVRSTPTTVFIAPMADSPAEARLRRDLLAVPRRTIVDVDSPGLAPEVGGWALIGGGVASLASTGLLVYFSHLAEDEAPGVGLLAVPVTAGGVLLATGIAVVSWAWEIEGRSRHAAGRFDPSLEARRAAYPPYVERQQRHAARDMANTVQLGVKSVVCSDSEAPSLGLTAGLALPIGSRFRVEPAAEVDVANASPETIVRLPLRLGVNFRFVDSGYRLHIVPELGYSAVFSGEAGHRNLHHGFTGGLMIVHTVPWGERTELELGHGVTLTRFDGPVSVGRYHSSIGANLVDTLHLRLGVRYDL